jgi:hypothetical protein
MRAIGRFSAAAAILAAVWTTTVSAAADDTIFLKCIGTKEWSGTDFPQMIDNNYIEYVKAVPSLRVFQVYWPKNKKWGHDECKVHGTNCTFNENVISWDRRSYTHGLFVKKHMTLEKRSIVRETGKSEGFLREEMVGNGQTVLQIILTHTECEKSESPTSHFRLKDLFRFGK